MNVAIRGGKEIPGLDELKSILIKQFPMYKIRLFGKQVIWVTKSYYVGAKIGVSFSKREIAIQKWSGSIWANVSITGGFFYPFIGISGRKQLETEIGEYLNSIYNSD